MFFINYIIYVKKLSVLFYNVVDMCNSVWQLSILMDGSMWSYLQCFYTVIKPYDGSMGCGYVATRIAGTGELPKIY